MEIICNAVIALSDGHYTDDDQSSNVNNQLYQPPLNLPLSRHSLSGPRNLVSDARDRVLVAVLSNFSERRDKEMAEVYFPTSVFSYHSQSFLKIQRREQQISEASYRDKERERTSINQEAEIQGLQSDMLNLQDEVVDLMNKLHKYEGNVNVEFSSSNSAGVCIQSLVKNTGLNKNSQHARASPST